MDSKVKLEGVSAEVKAISPLLTHLDRYGETVTRRNWDVLCAAMEGPGESTTEVRTVEDTTA